MNWDQLFALAAVLGSGLVGGLCFAFSSFIMRAFDELGAPQAIQAMQSINAVILRSTAMAVWMGTVVVGIVAAVLSEQSAIAGSAAGLYSVAALLITGRGNVPLNEALDRVDPASDEADKAWRHYRCAWGRWNALRTVLCLGACAGFAWVA